MLFPVINKTKNKINRLRFAKKLKPAVFMHIQKTAGSSIVDLARIYYTSVISHGDFIDHDPDDFNNIRFVSGHFGYEYARHFIPKRYSFVILRDPIERILSYYYYLRYVEPVDSKITHLARELDLVHFLELGYSDEDIMLRFVNHQAFQLAYGYGFNTTRYRTSFSKDELEELALEHLDELSYVGFTETFGEDSHTIFSALGLPIPCDEIRSNVNLLRPDNEKIPAVAEEIIHEFTLSDRLVYDEAWSKKKCQTG